MWTRINIGEQVVDGEENEGAQVLKIIHIVSYALKQGVCGLFQVIKQISTGLYV